MLLYQNKDITMKTNLNPKTVEKSKEDLRQAGIHKKKNNLVTVLKRAISRFLHAKALPISFLITSLVCYVSKEH